VSCVVYYFALLIPSDLDKDCTHLCSHSTPNYVFNDQFWTCPAGGRPSEVARITSRMPMEVARSTLEAFQSLENSDLWHAKAARF
jgi:hypothetical protein